MKRFTKGMRVVLTALGAVFVLGACASLILARTAPGRALVLRQMLDRAGSSIAGDLTVGTISSTRGLFTGFTLHDVNLSGPDGELVAHADSARVGYDFVSLITTRTLSVRAYHPDVLLKRLDDGRWNLVAAVAAPEPSTQMAGADGDSVAWSADSIASPGDSATVGFIGVTGGVAELEDVRIVNGTFRIEQDDGGLLVLDAIEAVVPELALGLSQGADRAEVSYLSLRGHFEDGLLDVQTARGVLLRTGTVLEVEVDRLELAESQGKGTAKVDWTSAKGVDVTFGLDVRRLSLADLHWLDGRIPEGAGSGAVEAEMNLGRGSSWRFSGLDLASGPSRLTGSGGLTVADRRARLESVDVRARDFDMALVAPWVVPAADSLPPWLSGSVSGPVRASGPLASVSVAAEVDVLPVGAEEPIQLDLRGGLLVSDDPGAADLRVVARDFDLRWLGMAALEGRVNVDARLDGRLGEGIDVTGDLLRLSQAAPSVIRVDGTMARIDESWPVNALVLFEPLQLGHVASLAPAAQLTGMVRGSARLSGTVRNMTVVTALQTDGGPLNLEARLNVLDPTASVRVSGPLEGVDISTVSGRFPEPTVLRGSVDADLSLRPAPVGRLAMDLVDSSVGSLRIHRTVFGGVARAGVFELDSLDVRTSAVDLRGTGTLALVDTMPPGRIQLQATAASLEGLRPLLFGDSLMVTDELTEADLEFLEIQGVDVDTLPTSDQVRVAGSGEGDFVITGHLAAWEAAGSITLADAAYGRYEADSASVDLTSLAWPSRAFALSARSGETRVWDRAFRSGEFDLEFENGAGRVVAALVRSPEEDIRVRAGFQLADSLTTVNLDQATIRSAGERWNLGGPASASWGPAGMTVQDFRLVRPEDGGLRISVDGALPATGDGDLRVSALRVDLERVAQVLQHEDQNVRGTMDLRLRLRGSMAEPLMNGTVDANGVRFRSVNLTNVGGEVRYADEGLSGDLRASVGPTLALSIGGTVPASLSFSPIPAASFVDAPINVAVTADSVPLDAVLGFFEGYEQVEGSVTGNVDISGRPDDLQPEGALRVNNGAATITFFGIRPRDFNGTFDLSPDGRVAVDATFREGGVGRVAGIVNLNPITDPGFDLDITSNRLRAVARRDVEGVVTGTANLSGSFTRPVVRGALTADEGSLFIDEVVRSAEVFDLDDPEFLRDFNFTQDVEGEAADEVNPFIQNLLADVSLTMVRNSWLRSQRLNQSMNVELSGTVDMRFDRGRRSLALLGELQAVRGTYTTLGRNFTIEEGTVRFVGTPDLNPGLDFTADFQVPRREGPLDITANVGGTLLQPSLRLSSEDQALAESDLYSYLLFGQPTYALSNSQANLVSSAQQASVNLALGTIASQLGSFLNSEDIPIDYLDISTSQYFDFGGDFAGQNLASEVRSTGVTIGKYISDDVFLGVRWRPFSSQGAANRNSFSGRLEWRFRDEWALEAFAEDRTLNATFASLDALGFDLSKVFGLFVFREWGY